MIKRQSRDQVFMMFSSLMKMNKNSGKTQIFMMNFTKLNLNKYQAKGQIFMMDLIFSFVILMVAIGVASFYYSETSQNEGLYEYTQDILDRYTTTSINSLNSDEIRLLFSEGEIKNIDFSIAQQVSDFYYRGEIGLAENVTRIFIENFDRPEYVMNITINNGSGPVELYSSRIIRNSFEESTTSYALSRDVISFINGSKLIGPYEFTILIWQ